MTRNEFLDEITDFGELRTFCIDNDISYFTDEIYDDYERDDILSDYVGDCLHDGVSWKDIRDGLNGVSDTEYWHLYEGGFDWTELSDMDFQDKRDEVLEYCDEHGLFDNDPEEEDDDDAGEPAAEEEDALPELPPLRIDESIAGFLSDAVSEYETAVHGLQTITDDGADSDEEKLLQVIAG